MRKVTEKELEALKAKGYKVVPIVPPSFLVKSDFPQYRICHNSINDTTVVVMEQ
jgi:hypothetical protein